MLIKIKADELRSVAKSKKISLADLSLEIGMCKNFISSAINKQTLSEQPSIKIAQKLGVDWNEIFEWDNTFVPVRNVRKVKEKVSTNNERLTEKEERILNNLIMELRKVKNT